MELATVSAENLSDRQIGFRDFQLLSSVLPECSDGGPWIAGGAVRRPVAGGTPKDSDFDYFFKDEKQLEDFRGRMERLGLTKLYSNDFNETFSGKLKVDGKDTQVKVQAIKFRFYESLSDVLDSFDFTICQFGWNGCDVYFNPCSIIDVANKRLVVHKISFGVSTMRRLVGYSKQGYYACSGALEAILKAIAQDDSLIRSDVEYLD